MPVADNAPHEQTRREGTQPYSCFNKEKASDGYWMSHRRYALDGSFTVGLRWIKHTMSVGCRYDRSLTDPRCEGCVRRGEGEEYSREVAAAANRTLNKGDN